MFFMVILEGKAMSLCLYVLAVAMAGSSLGATIHVAPGGDGSAPQSGDSRTAFSTLAAAARVAKAGDTIDVFSGEYVGLVILRDGVSLRGRDPKPVVRAKDDPVLRLGSDVTIENLHLIGVDGEAVVYLSYRKRNVTVRNCVIEGGRTGISSAGTSGVTIIRCTVRGNRSAGIELDRGPGRPNRIIACTIYRNGRNALRLRGAGKWRVESNTIALNAADGINVDRCSPVIWNNIIAHNSRYGIWEGVQNCIPEVKHNVFFANPAGAYRQATTATPIDISGMNALRDNCDKNAEIGPQFASVVPGREDLRLRVGSPAFTAGRLGARAGANDAAGPTPPVPDPPWRVTAIDSMTLIPRELPWCDLPDRKIINLSAARGETASFQIAVIPLSDDTRTWRVEVPKLVGPGVEKLSGIKVSCLGYIRRTHSGARSRLSRWLIASGGNRWQPDVLLDEPPAARPGLVQAAWVGISVPPTAVAGEYLGTASVTAPEVKPQKIIIRLRVHRFSIPNKQTIPATFDYSLSALRQEYGDRSEAAHKWLYDDMLSHRIAPLLYLDPTSAGFEARVREHITGGARIFAIHCSEMVTGWPDNDLRLERLLPAYQAGARKLEELNLLSRACVRPWLHLSMPDNRFGAVCDLLERAYQGLRRLAVVDSSFDPMRFNKALPSCEIWCAEPVAVFRRDAIMTVHSKGKRIWMELSDFDHRRPGLTLDDEPIDWVMGPWLAWAHDLDGLFYWNVNAWRTRAAPRALMRFVDHAGQGQPEPLVLARPNLYGVLYYPGKAHPLRSIRLEIFRAGLQDYERLVQLAKQVKRAELGGIHADLVAEGKDLLARARSLAPHPSKFPRDARAILELREKIGRCLEKFHPKK